jgi:hypothetical protein
MGFARRHHHAAGDDSRQPRKGGSVVDMLDDVVGSHRGQRDVSFVNASNSSKSPHT